MQNKTIRNLILFGVIILQCSLGIPVQAAQVKPEGMWLHGFYAISSSSQMDVISMLDAVSFGWAKAAYDEVTEAVHLNTSSAFGNVFYVPKGFEKPMDVATQQGVEKYVMVYLEDQVIKVDALGKPIMLTDILFSNSQMTQQLIQEIVSLCQNLTRDGVTRSFDGVTIDFENFTQAKLREPFNQFLKQLKQELVKTGKKLNVAVQPNTNFKGYDYREIGESADRVILMAHDYAPKNLSEAEKNRGTTVTPITPIQQVKEDLKAIIHPETGVKALDKVVLQLSFASTQWQLKDGKILHNKPYTPSYDKIYQRLLSPKTEKFYHEIYANPYATYVESGIRNVIWYENETSVKAKLEVAKQLGVKGISLWRLGTIPNFKDTQAATVRLNIVETLSKVTGK